MWQSCEGGIIGSAPTAPHPLAAKCPVSCAGGPGDKRRSTCREVSARRKEGQGLRREGQEGEGGSAEVRETETCRKWEQCEECQDGKDKQAKVEDDAFAIPK